MLTARPLPQASAPRPAHRAQGSPLSLWSPCEKGERAANQNRPPHRTQHRACLCRSPCSGRARGTHLGALGLGPGPLIETEEEEGLADRVPTCRADY